MKDFFEFLDTLRDGDVYIQTHNFPDPDAIASAYGLRELLKHYGILATLCYVGRIDKLNTKKMTMMFNIDLHPYEELKENMTEDKSLVICVDSQKQGGNIMDITGDEVAAIDHHPTYVPVEYRYSDIRITGSCSTLIAEYFKKLNVPMASDVATALLYGLKMDTLHFSRGVTDLDIDMFAYLHPRADNDKLISLEKNTMEMNDLKAYGAAIENIELYGTTGFAQIPFACPDAMIAMVSDFILSVEEVDVAVIYSYRDDGIKFSVRSMSAGINAGDIANRALREYGNGGGHASMAGGFIPSANKDKLGVYPDTVIKQIFFDALDEC